MDLQEIVKKAQQAQEKFFERYPDAKPATDAEQKPKRKYNAAYPRQFTRTSPFYPLAQRDIATHVYLADMPIIENPWGRLLYDGPVLSTFDEDALLAVLALMDAGEGHPTDERYAYRGPLLPILRLMGYKAGKVGMTNYNRVKDALRRMGKASITLELANGSWEISPFLSKAIWDEDARELNVICNPYFYGQYLQGAITLLDVTERARLKKPTSKAIYRFVMSHKSRTWQGHMLTLARAINLATGIPRYKIRDNIKRGIAELVRENVLTGDSQFVAKDTVKLERQPRG
jgi:hypothetical protein